MLHYVAQGLNNWAIAQRMGQTEKGVNNVLTSIYQKVLGPIEHRNPYLHDRVCLAAIYNGAVRANPAVVLGTVAECIEMHGELPFDPMDTTAGPVPSVLDDLPRAS